ncbi:response regulator [Microbacterium sp. NE2HP2]|uniref:Response regulator n=1 Tax=Microbacterium plantarum TaxID=1816425 RepID=A0ABV5EUL3_9MICO|nr:MULTISPECIES: response regulator [Microbacterium]MCZ4067911.1 response regulator [Microbacterium sp. H37-C3]MDD7944835.1 response regulator [Microbacterium plantarum]RAZ31409.1 DNA-binding response regulator [Microbacterium sp. SMR1]WHE35240.1 response regulator [Microbacterium sp. BDGP8]
MTGPIRVLVVDDDRGARALHAGFVSDTPGFVVVATAGTGEAALEHSRSGVDLILLDMRLPGISGIEVLHRLRTLGDDGPDVLVISSSQDQTTVRQALAARVVGYLVKPFTQAALSERLERYAADRERIVSGDRDALLAQGEIDRLLSTGTIRTAPVAASGSHRGEGRMTGGGDHAGLPKGLAAPTLAQVVAALDPVVALTGAEVAAACGISRATANRYLTHLVDTGVIHLSHRYGKRGRPQVLYRLAPSPER